MFILKMYFTILKKIVLKKKIKLQSHVQWAALKHGNHQTVARGDKLGHNRETSQNHRVTEPSKHHQPRLLRAFIQMDLENHQGWRWHNLSLQPIPGINYPHDEIQKKKINPYLENQMVLPCIVSKDSTDAR